jgi:hypothetical protein
MVDRAMDFLRSALAVGMNGSVLPSRWGLDDRVGYYR